MLCDWRAISGAIEPFRSKIYFSTRAVISLSSPPPNSLLRTFFAPSDHACIIFHSFHHPLAIYPPSQNTSFCSFTSVLLIRVSLSHSDSVVPFFRHVELVKVILVLETEGRGGEGMIQLQFFATAALGECKRTAGWMDDKRRKVKTKKRKRQTVFNPTFVCILMRTQWAGVCVLASHD